MQVLLVLILGLTPLACGAVTPWGVLAFELAVIALVGGSVLLIALGSRWRVYRTPVDLFALAFLTCAAFSWLVSTYRYGTMVELFRLFAYASLFFVIVQTRRSRVQLWRIIWIVLVLGSICASLAPLGGSRTLVGFTSLENPGEPQGAGLLLTFVNRNHLAGYLELVFWLAVGLSLTYQGLRRALLIGIAATVGVTVLLSLSRGGFLALLSGFLTLSITLSLRREDRKALPWVGCLAALIAGIMVFVVNGDAFFSRISTLLHPLDAGRSRLEMWAGAAKLFRERPWLGWGYGTYEFVSSRYLPRTMTGFIIEHPHNEYIERASELGSIGTLLGLTLLGAFVSTGTRKLLRQQDSRLRRMGLGAMAGCISLLSHNIFDFHFAVPSNALLFVFCAALSLICGDLKSTSGMLWVNRRISLFSRRLAFCTIPLISLVAVSLVLRPYLSYRHLRAAEEALQTSDHANAEARIQAAMILEPSNVTPYAEMGWLLKLRASLAMSDEQRLALLRESLDYFQKAIHRNPNDGRLHNVKASLLKDLGRIPEARQAFEAAVAVDPMRAYLHYDLGRFLYDQGDAERSYNEYKIAIELNRRYIISILEGVRLSELDYHILRRVIPEDPEAIVNSVKYFLSVDEVWLAIRVLTFVLASQPTEANAERLLSALIVSFDSETNPQELLDYRSQFLRFEPLLRKESMPEAFSGEGEMSAAELHRLFSGRFAKPSLYKELARLYAKASEFEKSIAVYLRALEKYPGEMTVVLPLSTEFLREGRYPEALMILREALQRRPHDSRLHLHIYQVYSQMNLPHLALESLRKAVFSNPNKADYRYRLGMEYKRLGLFQEAAAEWQEVLRMHSEHVASRSALQKLLAELEPPEP